jgi:hypothetical protein
MTNEQLAAILAERVMGWHVGPERFQMGNRGWIPRGRFRPTERLQDAFRLVLAAEPTEYNMGGGKDEECWARVRIGESSGKASAPSMPAALCRALAQAIGIEAGTSG